jgi:Tol biopolymer transport system component
VEASWTAWIAGTPEDTAVPTKPAPRNDAWIAFIKDNNVWLIRPDGSELTQITDNLAVGQGEARQLGRLLWSRDGKRLAYSYGANGIFGIQLLNIETLKTGKLVLETGGGFDWSTTSSEVIFDTPIFTKSAPWRNVGLRVVKLADRNKRRVFQTPEQEYSPTQPQWSYDGLYVLTSAASGDEHDRTLFDMGSGAATSLAKVTGPVKMCDWGPMEPVLACLREPSPGQGQLLTIADVNGNILNDIQLPAEWNAAYVRWSPDARRLAIGYSQGDKPTETAVVSLGTRAVRPLARGGAPSWSADGKWVVTWEQETSPQASPHILVVNVDSGDMYPLADGSVPTWQPSGQPIGMEFLSVPTDYPNVDIYSTPLPDPYLAVMDTFEGDMLQVRSKGSVLELGPLEKGNFAIGPTNRFFVYCTNSGTVYAGRFGQEGLDAIGDIRKFTTIRRDGVPKLTFLFLGDNPYQVQITDVLTGENQSLPIPRYLTGDQ